MLEELNYWVAFSQITKLGYQKIQLLLNYFGNLETAWRASGRELNEAKLPEQIVNEILTRRSAISPEEEMLKLAKENISVVTVLQPDYPKLLKEIYSSPFILYYKGQLENLKEKSLAVVGTRRMSLYGKQAVTQLVEQLVENNWQIVSGLALGVDTQAHLTALNKKGTTVAVLGSGLDRQNIYPATNRSMTEEIIANRGLIISEYPIGMMPLKHNFPARNRIISGLTKGTLVIEAGERSGSLITAKFALEQNREVFSLPGPIHSETSVGTNELIKRGAKLVTGINDILEEFNLQDVLPLKPNPAYIPATPEEGQIMKYLSQTAKHIDDLVRLTGMPAAAVNAKMMELELQGLVKNLGGRNYIRSNQD